MSAAGTATYTEVDLRSDLGSWIDLLPDETLDTVVTLQRTAATLEAMATSDLVMSRQTRRMIVEEADRMRDQAYRAVAAGAAEVGIEDSE